MKAFVVLIALVATVALGEHCHAAELQVPGQYATIQAALDAAATGDLITIASGDYPENLVVKTAVTLFGAGADTTTVSGSALKGPVLLAKDVDGLVINGLRLFMVDVRKLEKDAPKHIVLEIAGGAVTASGCVLENGAGNGAAVTDGGNFTARDCTFLKNRGYGLGMGGAGVSADLENCRFVENKNAGLVAMDSASLRARRCTAELNEGVGIAAISADVWLEQCTARANKDLGIQLRDCANASMIESMAEKNKGSGIAVEGSGTAELRGNKCNENGYYGIYIDTGAVPKVDSNECSQNKRAGIFAAFTETAPEISRNRCEQNQMSGIMIYQGAHGTLRENICEKNVQSGISVHGLDTTAELIGNRCAENNIAGISVAHYGAATLSANVCEKNLGFGLLESSAGKAEVKDGNQLANNDVRERSEADTPLPFLHVEPLEYAWCFRTKRFDRLERLREHYVATQPADKSGDDILENFYDVMVHRMGRFRIPNWNEYFAQVEAWQAAKPGSPAPRILGMAGYTMAAWSARGSGYADTVTEAGWAEFRKQMGHARQYLAGIDESLYPLDPILYVNKISLLLDSSGNPAEIDATFRAAVARFPSYPLIYEARGRALATQWGGTFEEINAFLAEIPRLAPPEKAAVIYARCLTMFFRRGELHNAVDGDYHFDYALASKGFEELNRTYPDFVYAWNAYALVACVQKDQAKANEMFTKIGDGFGNQIWQGAANYERFRNWARGDTPYPKRLAGEKAAIPEPDAPQQLTSTVIVDKRPMPLPLALGGVAIASMVVAGILFVWKFRKR